MQSDHGGSWRLFRALGIDVHVHWSWFLALFIFYQLFGNRPVLFALLYGTLFGIVLIHEYGHALACRSTGGRVGHIVLWPLGGIAFTSPAPRPGALLWTIAAGPLVHLVLIPVALILAAIAGPLGAGQGVLAYLDLFVRINLLLFLFNMVPAYPLDGGQILHAILWFFLPQRRALHYAAAVGLAFGGLMIAFGLLGYANPELGRNLPISPVWMAILGFFIGSQAYHAYANTRNSPS